MKGLIATTLLLSAPFTSLWNQADVSQIFGKHQPVIQVINDDQFDQWQQQLMQEFNSLQSTLTNFNGQSPQVIDQQMQQMLNDIQRFNQSMINQQVLHRAGVKRLPQQPQNRQHRQAQNGIRLSAADSGITQNVLQTASGMIQQVALPILQQNLNQLPNSNTEITFFSSERSYAQALAQAGVPQQEIQAIVANTGGLTVGNSIWIPLYNTHDQTELANVLTHELTHVVFNQHGIGDQLPTWLNEGMAWHNGMLATNQLNPQAAAKETNFFNNQVKQAAEQGQLLPLAASENDILHAAYNVEWVDYLAVESLMKTYGEDQFQAFLAMIPQGGVERSFAAQFGTTMEQYEQEFLKSL